jgi:hypothetical protein
MRRKETWWLQGAFLIQKEKNKELFGHQEPFSSRTRKKNIWWPLGALTFDYKKTLEQNASLYAK